jgi:hypothetical protein
VLEQWGIEITISASTDDALGKLVRYSSSAVISDMGRPPDSKSGCTLLEQVRRLTVPFIIYASAVRAEHVAVARARGTQGSTGIPDILFDLVKEALGVK